LAWRQDGQTRLFASTERAQHKAQWSDPLSNKQVLLEYDAVHAPDVLLLNQLSSLVGIDCHADGRMLMWLNGTDPSLEALIAALRNKPLLSGGREWECGFSDQEADIGKDGQAFNWTVKTIQRRVLSVGAVKLNGQHVVVQVFTKPAGFAEMFQSARLSFKTTMFPKAHHLHDLAQDPAHRAAFKSYLSHVNVDSEADAKLGWWPFSAITKVVDDFKALGQKVADVVKTVVHVAVAIATGTVDYDHTEDLASLRWNYDASSSGHVERDNWVIDDSVTCVACFLDLEVGFHMDLHIRDFELVSVAAWIEGQMTSQVNMNLDAEAQYNRANDTVLATVKVPDIDIVIGEIPMTISITIPVHAGYVFDLDATATVSAKGKMSGQVKYGFQYMPQDTSPLGGFPYIHFNSMDHEGLAVNMSLDVSAQLDVYIMPVIDISIDHLGGPNIGIKGFVEPVIQFKSSSPCNRGSSPWGPGSTYTINWGLQLTIGARLDVTLGPIHVLDKSWGPDQIFHIKWPLSSGCLRLPTDALLRGPGALGLIEPHYLGDQLHFFDGVAYSGEVVVSGASGCDQLLSIPVHFQIMNSSSGPETQNYPVWTSHSPHNWNRTNPDSNISSSVNMGCVNQATYLAIYGKFELFQTPVGQQSIDYKNCTLDTIKQGFTLMSLSGSYTLSPDLSTLTIDTGSVCIGTVNLTRGLQAREGKRLGANPQYVWGSPRSATP